MHKITWLQAQNWWAVIISHYNGLFQHEK